MEKLQIILTEKGHYMISFHGFMFWYERDGIRKKIWRCREYQTLKCKARLHTVDSISNPEVIKTKGSHNHEPNPVKNKVKHALSQIRTKASVITSPPSQIIADNVSNLALAVKGALPRLDSIKRTIRNIRIATLGHFIVPQSRAEICLPEKLRMTSDLNPIPFLLFDSATIHPNKERIFIFGTHKNLNFLKLSDTWLIDGTFKCSPALFDQIFVIHAYRANSSFPLIYCLMPNRNTETYSRGPKRFRAKFITENHNVRF
jgi:FLYWCH zinc finger domain